MNSDSQISYRVVPKVGTPGRYVISDNTGRVVESAQGYGYKSIEAATKAMWYHFKGGKEKIRSIEEEARNFWRKHEKVKKELNDLFEMWIKELARGEISEQDLVDEVCKKYAMDNFPLKYLEYM